MTFSFIDNNNYDDDDDDAMPSLWKCIKSSYSELHLFSHFIFLWRSKINKIFSLCYDKAKKSRFQSISKASFILCEAVLWKGEPWKDEKWDEGKIENANTFLVSLSIIINIIHKRMLRKAIVIMGKNIYRKWRVCEFCNSFY